jgi:aminoglycoside phosphotransferase family enzyme
MTKEQINELVLKGQFPQSFGLPELVETHISWVVICDCFVYKIKKPIQYSFLDFSSLEKRKYYCEREVELNKRLTDDIYLDVQPVKKTLGGLLIGGEEGEVIDYAVRMRKLERDRQMDILLLNNKVTTSDIQKLAGKIAAFHKNTGIIYEKDFLDIQKKFNDLEEEIPYLQEYLNANSSIIIRHALVTSDKFIEKNKDLLASRLKGGFFRDCHGDLHSRNIFLLPSPEPFDCIEFNDDYRQIDVLNDVAFLCMDLDAFKRKDLSDLFLNCYNSLFPSIKTGDDRRLFIYYKSYRANIRAKVNSLRARFAKDDVQRISALAEANKYLDLMDGYMKMLEN